jgi:hypothetical protein
MTTPETQTKKQLKDLVVGDPVLVYRRWVGYSKAIVQEITKAGNIRVQESACSPALYTPYGSLRGPSFGYTTIQVFDQKLLDQQMAENRRKSLTLKLSSVTWDNLPTDLLQAIDFMLQTHAQAKELEKPEGDNGSQS